MSYVDVQQLKTQRAILVEAVRIRRLLTTAVRFLAKLANDLEPPARIPTSFHPTVSGEQPENS